MHIDSFVYVHFDKFGRIIKEGAMTNGGMEAKMIGKCPDEEGSWSTEGKKEQKG